MSYWMVAIAAAGGAVARYTLDFHLTARSASQLPWGTFVVNVSGSLALGMVAGWVLFHDAPMAWRIVLGTGFLGAYTTFSTWMMESLVLLQRGQRQAAVLNLAGSWAAGTAAAALGLGLALHWA